MTCFEKRFVTKSQEQLAFFPIRFTHRCHYSFSPRSIPRDLTSLFDPKIVGKYQIKTSEIEDKIISIYGLWLTTSDIPKHLLDIYGSDISKDLVSNITDKILHTFATIDITKNQRSIFTASRGSVAPKSKKDFLKGVILCRWNVVGIYFDDFYLFSLFQMYPNSRIVSGNHHAAKKLLRKHRFT